MPAVAFILHARDNVATVLGDDAQAEQPLALRGVRQGTCAPSAMIPDGHKFALTAIAAGAPVIKYGVTVGRATASIPPGGHVHIHNMESLRGRGDLADRKVSAIPEASDFDLSGQAPSQTSD